jgi:hypothetical protein
MTPSEHCYGPRLVSAATAAEQAVADKPNSHRRPLARSHSDLAALCEPVARIVWGEPSRGGCVGRTYVPCNWADMSLDALFACLDRARHFDGAPRSTLDALVLELRTHGIAALEYPSCLRRLDDVSTAQLREVIARLIELRPKYPVITDDLLMKIGGLL